MSVRTVNSQDSRYFDPLRLGYCDCPGCVSLFSLPGSCAITTLRKSCEMGCKYCMPLWKALSQKFDLNDPALELVYLTRKKGCLYLTAAPARLQFTPESLCNHMSIALAANGMYN